MVLLKNEQMDTSLKISPLYPEDIPAKKRSRRFSTKIRCKLLLVPKNGRQWMLYERLWIGAI